MRADGHVFPVSLPHSTSMEGKRDCCQGQDREDASAAGETPVSAVLPLGSVSLRISVCVSMASGKPINSTR